MADDRRLTEGQRRALAVKASCDPRTVEKVLRGEPVRGIAGERAHAALVDAGLLPPDAPLPRRAA